MASFTREEHAGVTHMGENLPASGDDQDSAGDGQDEADTPDTHQQVGTLMVGPELLRILLCPCEVHSAATGCHTMHGGEAWAKITQNIFMCALASHSARGCTERNI